MKRLLTFVIMALFFSNFRGYSQQLKTFNGLLDNGKASYQYIEDKNFNRIYHGKFNWMSGYADALQINGQYLNDKKTGLWIFKEINASNKNVIQLMTFNFADGLLNGTFKFENFTYRHTLIANFKNDYLIGAFSYASPTLTIKAKFDENGYADGKWEINFQENNINYNDTRTYTRGFLRNRLYRNLNSGEVIINIKDQNLYQGFETLTFQEIKKACLNNGYDIKHIPISHNSGFSLSNLFISQNNDGGYQYPSVKEKLTMYLHSFFTNNDIINKFKSVKHRQILNYYNDLIISDPDIIKWEGTRAFCNKDYAKKYLVITEPSPNTLITIKNITDNKVYFGFNRKEGLKMQLMEGDTENFRFQEGKLVVSKVVVKGNYITITEPQLIFECNECEN